VPSPSASAGIDIPLIRDPTYYPAKQLDVYPQPLAEIRLQYPETAGRADGLLLMLLLIDEFGAVNEVSVIEADPPGIFEEAARAVFQAARFSPGVRQGRTVKSRVLIRVKYTYGDTDGSLR
jgi:protein TonB